ncbi:MAG TPA: LysM peptidoglycan-binding domain-containing protein [Anaerolineales bacterium]|nr:LysM peptidoglycan-binding domain-containing protein [Anaerolineales bacterium]
MQALRQLGGGVIIALVSIILVVGGISLAIAESAAPPETPTPITPTVQFFLPSSTPPFATFPFETPTQTATLFPSATLIPPTSCNPPSGWFQTIVKLNDTIYSLSQRYNTSVDALRNANCLSSLDLQVGRVLYVPPVPTVTLISCGPPGSWVKNHVVRPGDNLFRIALSYGISYPQVQSANCMGSSTTIYAGQVLWVPNRPTLTPIPGVTITPTIPTSTASFTPVPPTSTLPPTLTSTFIATSSPVPAATQTNTSPAVITQTPSLTPFP